MDTYIYALDLSLNSTGICIFKDDGSFIEALTIDTNSEKETKLKLRKIGEEFKSLVKKYKPNKILIEQGFSMFNLSTQRLFMVHGLVSYIFSEYEQIYYPPTVIKKLLTGKGNSKKERVREEILRRYPDIVFKNLDESDAFSVGETYFIKQGIKYA